MRTHPAITSIPAKFNVISNQNVQLSLSKRLA